MESDSGIGKVAEMQAEIDEYRSKELPIHTHTHLDLDLDLER